MKGCLEEVLHYSLKHRAPSPCPSLSHPHTELKMTTKPLLLLSALALCCILTLGALPRQGCRCIRTTPKYIPVRRMDKIEVFPVSGQCRWLEIIVTTKKSATICLDPSATWVKNLLTNLQR
ncbi:C-X-C motif chemokine 13 [Halichoeres trimaculatus]|uniref:C-X-C motif chemokine 13 n=1 Tax=Halichoeres trimaculatus TaxID=147232 RepID=UPI003D9E385C